jgi:hypothetical protein
MFTWQNVTVLDRDWEDEYNEYLSSHTEENWTDEPECPMCNDTGIDPTEEDEWDCPACHGGHRR